MSFMTSFLIVLVGLWMMLMILNNVYQKKISERHGILWLFCASLIVVGGIFPNAVILLAKVFGIDYAPAGIFTFAILLLLILVYKDTQKISQLAIRVQELSMQIALLNLENKRIMDELSQQKKESKAEFMTGNDYEEHTICH